MKKSMKLTIGACSVAAAAAVVVPTAIVLSASKDNSLRAMGVKVQASENAKVWFVSDGNEIFDNSFNEQGLAAVAQYGNANKVSYNYHKPEKTDLTAGYKFAADNKAEIVVGTGEEHDKFAPQYFKNNIPFVGLDSSFNNLASVSDANKKMLVSIQYNAQHAGYLAGLYALKYIDAHKSELAPLKDGERYKVATYGGAALGAVSAWMDGFEMAVDLDVNDKIEMVYYNNTASIDDFSGGFDLNMEDGHSGAKALEITKRLIEKGADVIFPVAGGQTKITLDEIKRQKANVKVIGVDSDWRESYGSNLIIGSAVKDMETDVAAMLKTFYSNNIAKWNSTYSGRVKVGNVKFISNALGDDWRGGNSDVVIDSITKAQKNHIFGSIAAVKDKDWETVVAKEL